MERKPDQETREEWRAWLWMIACCTAMLAVIFLLGLAYWTS